MLTEDIKQMLSTTIKKLTGKVPESIHLEPSDNPDHGDFSTNSALTTSKQLKNKAPLVRGGANESEQGVFSSPREVAEELIAALPENDLISKTDIAGPGFINFWLSDKAYREAFSWLNNKIDQNSFGVLDIGKAQTAITDTSHPNVAKPMGVHHLLSTIIGQSINNLLKTCGYTLIKDNYLGDWGTQFGKLTYAIKTWGHMEVIKSDPIPELLKLYVKFHEEAEQNPTLEDQGRMEFKRLEEGNPESRKLLQWIVDLSLTEFQNIYDRLGVDFDLMNGESFYEDKMESIIKEGVRKGIIVEGEKGALIIPMNDPNKPPAIIRKKDGATLYATRDLARIKYWQDELKGDLGINVVDIAQKLYFEQLFESAQKMGFTKMKQVHIDFGRMEFPEGGMSTRKGKVVLLEEVLDEAERRAYEKIESHDSELSEQGKHELARIMGIGAIKYNVLSQNRNKNYTFDWNQMLSFEG
ncbi:MAG: arginine--tRNA ligase, partial [Candidatus Gracilibacteria bacterium]|nr:arginine--tRNA ligase [Candidatus Gracilibacteria bacterium]